MADTLVPMVPPRNDRRRLSHLKTSADSVEPAVDELSDDLIDVWEHAVTLSKGYEWQDAVSTRDAAPDRQELS